MKHLLSIRTNIFYNKNKKESGEEEYKKYHELIFLLDNPVYKKTNTDEIIRERGIEEVRFVVSEHAFDQMLLMLTEIKKVEQEDLS